MCESWRMIFDVTVEVRLRPGIADPQGATIERALPALGFDGVQDVKVGKSIRFTIEAPAESAAQAQVQDPFHRFPPHLPRGPPRRMTTDWFSRNSSRP